MKRIEAYELGAALKNEKLKIKHLDTDKLWKILDLRSLLENEAKLCSEGETALAKEFEAKLVGTSYVCPNAERGAEFKAKLDEFLQGESNVIVPAVLTREDIKAMTEDATLNVAAVIGKFLKA